jgi:hypothetical protein
VHQNDGRAGSLDTAPLPCDVSQCFTAKCATGMAQEDEQDRGDSGQLIDGGAGAGPRAQCEAENLGAEAAKPAEVKSVGSTENQAEGQPPDDVVDQDSPAGVPRQAAGRGGIGESGSSQRFREQTAKDDRPVTERLHRTQPQTCRCIA